MNFALIIPTRGDRPKFIKQCKYLISKQTLQPTEVIWMDYKPESSAKDITQRYRRGIEKATNKGYRFVVFWEDDDWYHPHYLEWLVNEWKKVKCPPAFGVGETYYYHHGIESAHYMHHPGRTSAFCTLLKLPWRVEWPADHYPYLDMWIHKHLQPVTVMFPKNKVYAIGIKHGLGLTGGGGHKERFPFNRKDFKKWFYEHVGKDKSFYDSMKKEMKAIGFPKTPSIKNKESNLPKIKRSNVRKRTVTSNSSRTQLRGRRAKIKKIRKR